MDENIKKTPETASDELAEQNLENVSGGTASNREYMVCSKCFDTRNKFVKVWAGEIFCPECGHRAWW